MRKSLFACAALGLSLGGPAWAQATCETSVEKEKVGEFIATYEVDAKGAVTSRTATFVPERNDDFGKQGDGFGRPGLMIDYQLGADGVLAGPTVVSVLVNRFKDVAGTTPSMKGVTYRVTIGEAPPMNLDAEGGYGQGLARALRQTPGKLVLVEVVNNKDKVVAAAKFDLGKTANLQKLVTTAQAAVDKGVAAYAALAAEGKAGKSCPVR
jgi:hypothetical protein